MTDRIEPALMPEEWARLEPTDFYGHEDGGVYVGGYKGGDLEIGTRYPALIALANAALPEDDPRKITREWIETLRWAAHYAQVSGVQSKASSLDAIADALKSYLPPK